MLTMQIKRTVLSFNCVPNFIFAYSLATRITKAFGITGTISKFAMRCCGARLKLGEAIYRGDLAGRNAIFATVM